MRAEQLKWASDLAEAAYFNFGPVPAGKALAGADLEDAMKADANSKILPNWPDARIADFVAHWRVVDHLEDALDKFNSIPPVVPSMTRESL